MRVPPEYLKKFEKSFEEHRENIQESLDSKDKKKVSVEIYPGGPVYEGDTDDVFLRTWSAAPPSSYIRVYDLELGLGHYADLREIDALGDNINDVLPDNGGIVDMKISTICDQVIQGFYVSEQEEEVGPFIEPCQECEGLHNR